MECLRVDGQQVVRLSSLGTGAQSWSRADDECYTQVRLTPSLVLRAGTSGLRARARGDGAVAWDTATSHPGHSVQAFLIAGSNVLVRSGGELISYRLSDGALQWKVALSGDVADWAADATRVYLAEGGKLVARALAGGAISWSQAVSVGNIVILPNRNELLLGSANGVSWRSTSTGAQLRGWGDAAWSTMAVSADDQRAYVSMSSQCYSGRGVGGIFAIRHSDAQQLWTTRLNERVWAKPAVTNGMVWGYSSGLIRYGGKSGFVGLDAATGEKLTQVELPYPGASRTLASAGHVIAPTAYRTYVLGVGPRQLSLPRPALPSTFTGRDYSASLKADGGKAPSHGR